MKVLYDYQVLLFQRYGGISRYYYEIYNRIRSMGEDTSIHCLFNKNAYFESELNCHYKEEYSKIPFKSLINKLYTINDVWRQKYDIIHPTYYDPYIIGKHKGKLVVTVHDMIHEKYYGVDVDARTIKNKKKMIYAADQIIVVSENTKQDLLSYYPDIKEENIAVVYHGSSFKPHKFNKANEDFPSKYILFVGNRGEYKNYNRFFKAIEPILADMDDLYLVSIGGGLFNDEERIMHKSVKEKVIHMDADDMTLSYAYSNALCFVFPSLYEGFGIPVLEAFSCGCPVVLSNTSSLPEVGGNAVVYIDPYNIENIEHEVRNLIGDEEKMMKMVEKGKKQLKKFNWDLAAEQTLECYRRVLGN
ncbi:glycosyltransferase family 1 protein [Butyrivibrio sp. INlla16]|uniref:glycosyltransferase family 4 protein n=1 Tax=Butyrivibrio sp. INlla16 TaxID=1520807 RepID=UPI000885CF67|nr:glycosyltransferase family 1 protein [Butyrivibrio sp. INlla16]SDB68202.1 Glycosyltransferase involved in cell wall bisynthesis [Butyrivibrio sp. INlla16]